MFVSTLLILTQSVQKCNKHATAFHHYSNIGGATINDVALDFWHSGQNREDIGMEDLEHRLRAETLETQGTRLSQVNVQIVNCLFSLQLAN